MHLNIRTLVVALLWVVPAVADDKPSGSPKSSGQSVPPDTFIHYIPTPQEVVDKMLEMADLKEGDVVYDLGSGDGRVVITAAKKYGVKAVGIDIDPEMVRKSRENARKAGVEHLVTIKQDDIFKADMREATVLTAYLNAKLLTKLAPEFAKLKPGTRVVVHDYYRGMEPKRIVKIRPKVSLTPEERRELEGMYKGDDHTLEFIAELAAGREHDLYLHVVPGGNDKK